MQAVFKNNDAVSVVKNFLSASKAREYAVLLVLGCALFLALMHGCLADDLLKPGDTTVKDTFGQDSSLMTWLLIGEVVTGILTYVVTKNIKILFGVIVLSVFINIAFAVIGG